MTSDTTTTAGARTQLGYVGTFRRFTKREWKALPIVAKASETRGVIRRYLGDLWEWHSVGSHVLAIKVEHARSAPSEGIRTN